MSAASVRFLRSGKKIVFSVFIIICILSLIPLADADDGKDLLKGSSGPMKVTDVIFFYGDGCVHCEDIRPLVDDLADRYGLNIRYLEVYHNTTNQERIQQVFTFHNTTPMIPALVAGDEILVGEIQIRDGAEQLIIRLQQENTGQNTTTLPGTTGTNLTLPLVIGSALVDSTNPCGLSVLVFLLITMATVGSRKRILLVSGAYIFATFLFHLLLGFGLFSLFSLSGLSKLFSIVGGFIALFFGIINIADLLRNKETFFLSISESKKGLLGSYARMASIPAAFVLGILAGILGFTCTGGIYISILGLMGRDLTFNVGFPWLVLYNLVYVLPLVVVTVLVVYGVSPEQADRLRTRYKRPLRAIISLILIALGTIILFTWMG